MRDKPRPGKPAEAVASTMAANVKFLVIKIAVTLQEVAYQFSSGKASTRKKKKKKIWAR